jgi:hypothetical protein
MSAAIHTRGPALAARLAEELPFALLAGPGD